MTAKHVLVGFSGGVDSFYASYLLKEQGYEVHPILFRFSGKENIKKAEIFAQKLGLELTVIDYRDLFLEKVVKQFINYYKKGLTPNPCALCNREMKLDKLLQFSEKLDIPFIATGHYVTIGFSQLYGKRLIHRGIEKGKEQSYFLSLISNKIMEKLILPLGKFFKSDVIDRASSLGYSFKSESQDICFIDEDINSFLEKYLKPEKGNFLLNDGTKVGEFSSYFKYTVGQRKGLGISYKYPLYVTAIIPDKKIIIVGPKEDLLKDSFYIKDIVWHVPYGEIDWCSVSVQIRYRGKTASVKRIELLKNGVVFVKLHPSLDAPTPGQVCAFYYGDILLGGGEITTLERG